MKSNPSVLPLSDETIVPLAAVVVFGTQKVGTTLVSLCAADADLSTGSATSVANIVCGHEAQYIVVASVVGYTQRATPGLDRHLGDDGDTLGESMSIESGASLRLVVVLCSLSLGKQWSFPPMMCSPSSV